MIRVSSLIVVLLLAGASPRPAAPGRTLALWYRQPAATWTEALPVGNGRLGAMVFGGVASERIQLNEDSVWAGEKRDRNNPEGARSLAEVRRLLREGRPREAEALADKTIISVPRRLPPYQPLGDLRLRFTGHDDAGDYARELDLETGIVRVSYRAGAARYTREVFSSAADQVIVVRLAGDRAGGLSFAATLGREEDARARVVAPDRVA
ncbi:MAG TPA: glycoside hydrolase family 95 protein, partial [Blastocatellia bacterium]|nr:glycoside hydrolase family 95 protein [Blastocatellia bacterium]